MSVSEITSTDSFESEVEGFFSVTRGNKDLLFQAFVNNEDAVMCYKPKRFRGGDSNNFCKYLHHIPEKPKRDFVHWIHFTSPEHDRSDVRAFYASDPSTKKSKWGAFDIDAHSEEDDPQKNWERALKLKTDLEAKGLNVLIEDSNGVGGYHLWIIFAQPVSSSSLYHFLKEVRGKLPIEMFPSQPSIAKVGSALRPPGLHHTRDHVSRFWDGGNWKTGSEAAQYLINFLQTQTNDPKLIPAYNPDPRVAQAKPTTSADLEEIEELLDYLPSEYCDDRDEWKRVMLALGNEALKSPHRADALKQLAYQFSSNWNDFDDDDFERDWNQLALQSDGSITIGTLYYEAQKHGWEREGIDPEDPETWGGFGLVSPEIAEYLNKSSRERRIHEGVDENEKPDIEQEEDRTFQGLAKQLLRSHYTDNQGRRLLWIWRENIYLYIPKLNRYKPLSSKGLKRDVNKKLAMLVQKLYDSDIALWKRGDGSGKKPGKLSLSGSTVESVKTNLESMIQADDEGQDINQWISRIDRKKRYLPLQNGILDIFKAASGEENCLIPHSPEFFNLTVLPFDYDPTAKCGRFFEHYCKTSLEGDQDKITLFLEYLGYVLSGSTDAHKALILLGSAASGKSSGAGIYQAVVGSENVTGLKLKRLTGQFSLYPTYGKILNICPEIEPDGLLNDSIFKSFVCGDPTEFEGKGKDAFTASPTARLLICGNELPAVIDKSDGVWRRFMILVMDKTILEKDRIAGFDKPNFWLDKGELPGILNAALSALGDFIKRDYKFVEPQSSKDILEEAKIESCSVKAFLRECTHQDPNGKQSKDHVYRLYQKWMEDSGRHCPVRKNKFGKILNTVYPQDIKKNPRMKLIDEITKKESVETAYTGFSFDPGTVGGEPIIPDQKGDYRIVKDLPGWIASAN